MSEKTPSTNLNDSKYSEREYWGVRNEVSQNNKHLFLRLRFNLYYVRINKNKILKKTKYFKFSNILKKIGNSLQSLIK